MSLSLQRRLVLNFFLVSLVSMLVVAYIPLRAYNLVLEQANEKKLNETESALVRNIKSRITTATKLARSLSADEAFISLIRSEKTWTTVEDLNKITPLGLQPTDTITLIRFLQPYQCKDLITDVTDQPKALQIPQLLEYSGLTPDSSYILGSYQEIYVEVEGKTMKLGGVIVGEPFTEGTLKSLLGATDVGAYMSPKTKALMDSLSFNNRSQLDGKKSVYLPEAHTQGTNLVYQARLIPVLNQRGDWPRYITLSLQQPASLTAWSELKTYFLISLLAGIMMALLTGYVVSRSISRPVRTLVAGVQDASNGNLGQYIVSERDDEVGELAKNFNTMTERLRLSLRQLHERAQTIEDKNIMLQQTLDELTRMRDYMENILTSIKSGVITFDLDLNITTANSEAAQILALKHIALGPARDVLDPELVKLAREALTRGRIYASHEILLDRDEDKKILDVSSSLLKDGHDTIGVVLTFKDLTEIKALEDQVSRQERLAALGQLSAGVAHEIRNPLGIIKGSAEILKKRFAHLPEEEGLSEFIIDEVKRLSKVVTNFLDFARPKNPTLMEMDINGVLSYTVDLVERQATSSPYQILRELHPHPLMVSLDREQFHQVFLNLILNGMDAMPDGGVLIVRSRISSHDGAPVVEIQDHGIGIPEANLEKIFNPFFTTKERGTGLGLSIVHKIVESHGARLLVESDQGEGSTFKIVFPPGKHRQTHIYGEEDETG